MPASRPDLIKWDVDRDEPYLTLPSFPKLRITPFRRDDGPRLMELYNEPGVAKYSYIRPYPYLTEHLDYIWDHFLAPTEKVINNVYRPFFTGNSDGQIPLQKESDDVPFCPFFAIRHTATNELVGDLSLYKDVLIAPNATSPADAERVQEEPEEVWEIAYNIFPEWRGKGLGGEVIGVLIEGWALQTNLTAVWAGAETLNPASAGLLRSRGFKKVKTFMVKWPEEKGGGEREVSTFKLELSEYVSKLPPPRALEA